MECSATCQELCCTFHVWYLRITPGPWKAGGPPFCSSGKLELKDVVLLEAAQLESSRAGRQESHLAIGWRGLTPKT